MMREMAFVVISCLAFSLFEAFIILPAHLGHKKVLAETKAHTFSYTKGGIFMVVGLAVIYIATRLLPSEPSFGLILFPFCLIIAVAMILFAGFVKSPMENNVRSAADKGIKYVRDKWFNKAVEMIIGTKWKWYRLGFFFPMIFLFAVISLFAKGVISFTFFPDIQPDFFTIEAAYKPGDNKEKSVQFVQKATEILFEENQRIIDETGDSLLTYYSSNIGFGINIGQAGNHASMVQVFFNGEDSKTPVDTLMTRIIARIEASDEGKLAQDTYVGGFNRFGKEVELGITAPNEASLSWLDRLFCY